MLKNDVIIPGNQWPIEDTDEQYRQHRICENRLLFRGRMHQIQSMINWNQRVTSDWSGCVPALVAANFYKPITLLCADLLYGEQGDGIGAACVNKKTGEAVKRIIKDNKFNALAYEVGGLAASYRKDGLYSIAYNDKQKKVKIYSQPANYWFPVVEQGNVKRIIQDIVAWPEKYNGRFYLRKQVHEPGAVWNFMYELNQVHIDQNKKNSIENHIRDAKIGRLVRMSDFGIETLEYVDTKIERSLIVHCPNWGVDDDIHGIDDYEDLDTLIIELAVMLSRNSLVLAKHTDPNMCGDPVLLQQDEFGNYKLPMGGKFFPYSQDGAKPEYLTWDGKLEAAEKQIDRLIELIFYISETSPAAFGMDKVSSTESGAALKKRLMRTIAKVNRKKMYADPAIRSALEIAQMMDVEWAGGNYEVEEPTITWEDGLPDDEMEQAQIVGQRVKDGTMSQLEGIMKLDKCDEETARKKLKQIQEEKDAALPSFGRSPNGTQDNGNSGSRQPPNNPFQQVAAGN